MSWYVIGHPELGKAVVNDTAVEHYTGRGWLKLSEPAAARDDLDPSKYAVPSTPTKTGKEK